jgi:6-phosphofructokinase 1
LALMAGVATGADFVFIPEKPRPDNWREEMCKIVARVCFLYHKLDITTDSQ